MVARARVPHMTGTQLQDTVIEMCAVMNLHVAHFRPCRTAQGWRTAVQGNGKGFPDLYILGPTDDLWREVKMPGEAISAEQAEWIRRLTAAGRNVGIWRPADLRAGLIQHELESIRRKAAR